jgi:hypothetical protein
MNQFRLIAPIMAILALLSGASPSWAGLHLYLQEAGVNGGLLTEVASGSDFSSFSFSGTYGDFKVTIAGASSDNAASLSDILSSTNNVTNNSSLAKTLKIVVSQTDYTLPTGPKLFVESGLGGSVSKGTVGLTGIFQAYADKNNNLKGMSDFSNGPQDATQMGSTFQTGSANGIFNRNPTNYSLTSVVTFKLSPKGTANFSDHVNVTATPAPAGLLLAASGLPVLALSWLRRRKLKVQQS